MVVRLQTAEGKIKEYQTVYGVGPTIGDQVSGYDKWITKCKREWDKEPEPHQECDHLECAIYIVEDWRLKEIAGWLLAAIAAIFFGISIIEHATYPFLISVFSAIFAIASLAWGREEENRWNELNEFRDKGTIKGIMASQIFYDGEVAKA